MTPSHIQPESTATSGGEGGGGFTAGPWEELHNTAGPMGVIALRVPLESSERICWLEIHGREHANARLIAAAPNMLRALQLSELSEDEHNNCEDCDGEIEAELCGTCFPLADEARLARRAALSKALGADPKAGA